MWMSIAACRFSVLFRLQKEGGPPSVETRWSSPSSLNFFYSSFCWLSPLQEVSVSVSFVSLVCTCLVFLIRGFTVVESRYGVATSSSSSTHVERKRPSSLGRRNSTVPGAPTRYCSCTNTMCNCCRDFTLPVVTIKGPGEPPPSRRHPLHTSSCLMLGFAFRLRQPHLRRRRLHDGHHELRWPGAPQHNYLWWEPTFLYLYYMAEIE